MGVMVLSTGLYRDAKRTYYVNRVNNISFWRDVFCVLCAAIGCIACTRYLLRCLD